jgi:hypothetical protein
MEGCDMRVPAWIVLGVAACHGVDPPLDDMVEIAIAAPPRFGPRCDGDGWVPTFLRGAEYGYLPGGPFRIDRNAVACDGYERCAKAGSCPSDRDDMDADFDKTHINHLCAGASTATYEAAADYCAWRGMRLPTLAEWQLAVSEGGGTQLAPGCDPEDPPFELRKFTSPSGVRYMLGAYAWEWTADYECRGYVRVHVGADLHGACELDASMLELEPPNPGLALFRCVAPATQP